MDTEPPIASFLKSMLIGGGPVNAAVRRHDNENPVAYYIRILTPSENVLSLETIQAALDQEKLAATVTLESGTVNQWAQVILSHKGGPEIAVIECNSQSSTELVAEEIDEFLDDIADCKPASAVVWLSKYLPTVRTIYAFQPMSGTEVKDGWNILGIVKNLIFQNVDGILQADGEGFSDEEGYHILWQFSSSVKGTWWMSVLKDGKWVRFQMDLGSKRHRDAFFRGEVPDGVQMAE